jgi:hypothetical protein
MITWRPIALSIGLAGMVSILGLVYMQGAAAGSAASDRRKHVTIELTEDFYRALRNEDAKTYSTERKDEYLRQIAVSTKFMVETNLRILEQQARMIELLEKNAVKP